MADKTHQWSKEEPIKLHHGLDAASSCSLLTLKLFDDDSCRQMFPPMPILATAFDDE